MTTNRYEIHSWCSDQPPCPSKTRVRFIARKFNTLDEARDFVEDFRGNYSSYKLSHAAKQDPCFLIMRKETMRGHYHYDGDEYCANCLPAREGELEVDVDLGEQDTPANCCVCHAKLNYSLTQAGVRYVLEKLLDHIRNPEAGERDVLLDWATDLKWYMLPVKQANLLDCFLNRFAP
jgi:hypothetical protein